MCVCVCNWLCEKENERENVSMFTYFSFSVTVVSSSEAMCVHFWKYTSAFLPVAVSSQKISVILLWQRISLQSEPAAVETDWVCPACDIKSHFKTYTVDPCIIEGEDILGASLLLWNVTVSCSNLVLVVLTLMSNLKIQFTKKRTNNKTISDNSSKWKPPFKF